MPSQRRASASDRPGAHSAESQTTKSHDHIFVPDHVRSDHGRTAADLKDMRDESLRE